MSLQEELKQYSGNCHCGKVKFTVDLAPLTKLKSCDCSICSIHGYLFSFSEKQVPVFTTGEALLTEYTFGSKTYAHKFCSNCGTAITISSVDAPTESQRLTAVNLRTLKDFDPNDYEMGRVRASKLPSSYVKPDVPGYTGQTQGNLRQYKGSCHCGAVKVLVMHEPLETAKVMSCNCSLCTRNAYLNIYPPRSAVTIVQGEDAVEKYAFLSPDSLHCFCRTCGSSTFVQVTDPEEDILPLNVRMLHDVDLEHLNLQTYDGRAKDPQYKV